MAKLSDVVSVLAGAHRPKRSRPQERVVAPVANDGGFGVLTALLRDAPVEVGFVDQRAMTNWLDGFRNGVAHGGLSGGGLAGFTAGLAYAAAAEPRLAVLAGTARDRLIHWVEQRPWRTSQVSWHDYDLITGAAGVLLALASIPGRVPEHVRAVAAHLVALADRDDLARLRVGGYAGDESRGWNHGHLNYGVGHGIPGVVAALTAACRLLGPEPGFVTALRRITTVLRVASYVDGRGVVSWPPGSNGTDPAHAVRRQAWCYGTPGVAWTLWDAGQVLDDPGLSEFAANAMATACESWDDEHNLFGDTIGDHLAICHGAAGVLAIADAFARHADHEPSAGLREQLVDYLHRRRDAVEILAATDLTMLNGAAGVLCVLHTMAGGRRDWLSQLGLR